MPFTPTTDADTGTTFNGFTHEEAVWITSMMSTGSENFPDNTITIWIQLGHFYKPQLMIDELLAGRTFSVYDKSIGEHIIGWDDTYAIFYTSNLLFAYGKKIHSARFSDSLLSQVKTAYDTYKAIYTAAKAQYDAGTITYDQYKAIVNPAQDTYEATLETLMPVAAPLVVEETAQRNIYFDNKKRMLYIDGKYYNTLYIKRSTE